MDTYCPWLGPIQWGSDGSQSSQLPGVVLLVIHRSGVGEGITIVRGVRNASIPGSVRPHVLYTLSDQRADHTTRPCRVIAPACLPLVRAEMDLKGHRGHCSGGGLPVASYHGNPSRIWAWRLGVLVVFWQVLHHKGTGEYRVLVDWRIQVLHVSQDLGLDRAPWCTSVGMLTGGDNLAPWK